MEILVLGDYIEDRYVFGEATRLCPESPVPVIVPAQTRNSAGGAGLVGAQLEQLGADVFNWFGSWSHKERIYAGTHLICRLDKDSQPVAPCVWNDVMLEWADVIVVGDYGKGAITEELARKIVATGKPCFVDGKHHWHWYEGDNVTVFPNNLEAIPISIEEHDRLYGRGDGPTWHTVDGRTWHTVQFGRVVNKWGKNGSRLNDAEHKDLVIPATTGEVVDVCGAGDVFMAAFVYAWSIQLPIEDCLRFANALAGESCRHLGTYTVPREFAQPVLDSLRASRGPRPQAPGCSPGSMPEGQHKPPRPDHSWPPSAVSKFDSQTPSCEADAVKERGHRYILRPEQIPPESPSSPTASNATPTP
jgi:D-beta-D-heptose 7-phosphate kinase/D-beta-D-heptose 1-phosphate adenosyltransferase